MGCLELEWQFGINSQPGVLACAWNPKRCRQENGEYEIICGDRQAETQGEILS